MPSKRASATPAGTDSKVGRKKPARTGKGKTRRSLAGTPTSSKKAHQAADSILSLLKADYPDAQCALTHKTPFQLLVATILSAQCTDERVNIVTKDLFRKYKKPADFAKAPLSDIEEAIKSTGFFRNKAKNIKQCSLDLVERYGGSVPRELDALVGLAGVGRKTANVVLGTAFGIPTGVVVDTHVARLSQRMGLSKHKDPVKIEQDLMQAIPQDEWIDFSHRMILHGRQVCTARKPACEPCALNKVCPKIGVK